MLTTSFIEIGSHPVGLVWHEPVGCRFIAASQTLSSIDGRVFPSCEAATEAARSVLAEIGSPRKAKVERGAEPA
jgi:hypothetical protein